MLYNINVQIHLSVTHANLNGGIKFAILWKTALYCERFRFFIL